MPSHPVTKDYSVLKGVVDNPYGAMDRVDETEAIFGQVTNQKKKIVAEEPQSAKLSIDQIKIAENTSVMTIDSAVVDLLCANSCLSNQILWHYLLPGKPNAYGVTIAAKHIDMTGAHRIATRNEQIDRFWELHSRYVAPHAGELRQIYDGILRKMAQLFDTFGADHNMLNDFFNKLAEYSGEMGENERNRERFAPNYLEIFQNTQKLAKVVDSFLEQYGSIPRSAEFQNRVNVERNRNFHLTTTSVLAFAIRVIRTIIEKERRSGRIDNLIQWDLDNPGEVFPSIFYLTMEPLCSAMTDVTQLGTDFFGNTRLQDIRKQTSSDDHLELTQIFTYSNVGDSLQILVQTQENAMNGKDKKYFALHDLKGESFPPWKYRNGWPRDNTIEDTNLALINKVLDRDPSTRKRKRDPPNIDLPPSKRKTPKPIVVTPGAGDVAEDEIMISLGPNDNKRSYYLFAGLCLLGILFIYSR